MNSWLDAWHVNPSVNRDYDFIDGLRGIAILMVLCCHIIYVNPLSGPVTRFIGAILTAGKGGVVLFFAISGFLISWPFWKRKFTRADPVAPSGYAWRRFWKIYPPLALSIIILTPCYIMLFKDATYIPIAGEWLAGIPFFVPVNGKLNPVMWTLVVEVQFYMVLPLVFLLFKRVSARACLLMIPLIFLVIPAAFRARTGLNATYYPEINSHFPATLDSFCLGIFIAGLDIHGAFEKKWASLGICGFILWPITILLMAWTATHPALQGSVLDGSLPWLEKIASGFLLLYVANPKHGLAQLLCAPWLRWCGIVSYEWYLFHQPIAVWPRYIFGPTHGDLARYLPIVVGSFLGSGILAACIYRFFSLPILQYGRSKKKKVVAPVVSNV